MPRRSWIYLTLAFVVSAGELAYLALSGDREFSFGYVGPLESCLGNDLRDRVSTALWSGVDDTGTKFPDGVFVFLIDRLAPIAVVISIVVMVVTTMGGRPLLGRVSVRALAVAVLVAGGHTSAFALYDLFAGPRCLESWGGTEGLWFFTIPDGPLAVATALLMMLAARPARGEGPRVAGRILAGVAAAALLLAFVETDVSQAGAARVRCHDYPQTAQTSDEVFLCAMRESGRYRGVPDRDLLAYGRAACARYPLKEFSGHDLAPICPTAKRDVEAMTAARDAAFAASDAVTGAFCDQRRHRPKIRARQVVRDVIWPDYGVIESFEGDHYDDGLLDRSSGTGIATSRGHLLLSTHSDFENCVQVEVYDRRPPKERKGWDRVVEVGYTSPEGHMMLVDPMAADQGLTVPGLRPGRYRIRFHHAEPDYEKVTPQVVLLMIWPEP
ncbi:hypothetical protein [Herbidospora galbida]|uniref:hypothetical protein n=1 Tax=Herbidospora galbida TaxID=2575442 RepID=UPI0014853E5B|nr:hypothetical protein [Herbidospora galbida]